MVALEPISCDPNSDDFLAFSTSDSSKQKQKEIARFRASNIVSMRAFMASLGGRGPGLFSAKLEHGIMEDTIELPDASIGNQKSKHYIPTSFPIFCLSSSPKNYEEAMKLLPFEFFIPEDTGLKTIIDKKYQSSLHPSGTVLPLYDSSILVQATMTEKLLNGFFRYPYGPQVSYLMCLGYGTEIGLKPGLQEVWDSIRKASFFLDHVKQEMSYANPRVSIKATNPVVKKEERVYGDQRRQSFPHIISTDQAVVQNTAKRANSKPYGCVIYACGVNGNPGSPGVDGINGENGRNGANAGFFNTFLSNNGKPGSPGQPGLDASDGARGIDGTDASDVVIALSGDPSNLQISGTSKFIANLGGTSNEHILLVNCRGGNGGEGGCGGAGGKGGNGGKGGKGADGANATRAGGNGGNGGNGGAGGDGGPGGAGGRGGDGGDAGCGGTCVVQATDSCLLMLVEIDCTSGLPGKGGNGGRGGEGGMGGVGGKGGIGGSGGDGHTAGYDRNNRYHHAVSPGCHGANGSDGPYGRKGRNGLSGQIGQDGNPARQGNIQWVHYSAKDGSIFSKSSKRYDAEVTGYKVSSSIDDGIFEPNEMIIVSGVEVLNSGGLPLPEGAKAFFPSVKGINFLPDKYDLPGGILSGKKFTIPTAFKGRLCDQPSPNTPGPFVSSVDFCPRIELLGRPFEKSFHFRKLTVQYPVKLAYLKCLESLGKGEVSTINIGIQNISSLPYGNCAKSGGTVLVQLHFDHRLTPIGSACANITTQDVPYRVFHDREAPDSTFIEVSELKSHATVNLQVTIQMDSNAELFDRCIWQADLYLRGKLIEYNHAQIRVSPFYVPHEPTADVLFITSDNITRKEFVYWQWLFESLQLTVDFWDTNKYSGLSVDSRTNAEHKMSWKGRYDGKLILYPYCDLQKLHSIDIVRHLSGSVTQPRENHSSAVLVMPPQQCDLDKVILKYLSTATKGVSDIAYGGKHMSKPDLQKKSDLYLKCEKEVVKKLEKENPAQLSVIAGRYLNVQSTGTFKYSYGSVDIRRIPILSSAKFLVIESCSSISANLGADDPHLSPKATAVPLASIYGQIFLTVLFGIPISCKFNLIKESQPSKFKYSLPNGSNMSTPELAMVAIAWEVADEVCNFTGTSLRMQMLANDVKANTSAYIANGCAVVRGLELIKKEMKKRKDHLKKLCNSQTSRAYNEISQLCNQTEKLLSQRGVNTRGLDKLVGIDTLTNPGYFYQPHQLVRKDKKWDLTA